MRELDVSDLVDELRFLVFWLRSFVCDLFGLGRLFWEMLLKMFLKILVLDSVMVVEFVEFFVLLFRLLMGLLKGIVLWLGLY